MQTFNSCTKCLGIIHDRTPNCHPVYWAGMHDLTTGRSFDLQATFFLFRKCCFLLTTSAFTVYNDISIVFQVFFSIILFGSYRNSSMYKCIKNSSDSWLKHVKRACMHDLTIERSFDLQGTWVIDVIGLFFDVINGCLYKQAMADVRSTGSRIEYMYRNVHRVQQLGSYR